MKITGKRHGIAGHLQPFDVERLRQQAPSSHVQQVACSGRLRGRNPGYARVRLEDVFCRLRLAEAAGS